MPACRCPDVGGECREAFRPRKLRGGQWEFGEEELHHTVEQVRLVGHVTVEGHGRDTEALGKTGHGERVEPLFVGHRQGLG